VADGQRPTTSAELLIYINEIAQVAHWTPLPISSTFVVLDSEGDTPMTGPTLTLVETEHAFLCRRFNEEMAMSRLAHSLPVERVHAELACRYATRLADLEKHLDDSQCELPFLEGLALAS
jgi:hypothetical protein